MWDRKFLQSERPYSHAEDEREPSSFQSPLSSLIFTVLRSNTTGLILTFSEMEPQRQGEIHAAWSVI